MLQVSSSYPGPDPSRTVTCLFASGSNSVGQLGTGDENDSHIFAPCTFARPSSSSSQQGGNDAHSNQEAPLPGTLSVRDIAAGGRHTLALLELDDNRIELWGCGDGGRGQLGPRYADFPTTTVFRPIALELPPEIGSLGYGHRLIACSWETSYVVLSCAGRSDILFSMGADDFGSLGRVSCVEEDQSSGVTVHRVNFDRVLPSDCVSFVVASLSTGLYHVVARLTATMGDGTTRDIVVGWGFSRHGQLGSVLVEGPRPITIIHPDGDSVHSVSLGSHHSVFLLGSGRVYGLGSGKKHQLRGIDGEKGVKVVGCTWNGTYLVTGDGNDLRVLSTGSHSKGQLGRIIPDNLQSSNDDEISLSPVQFPFDVKTRRFVSMACGSEHVLVLFDVVSQGGTPSGSEVWGWGWNEHGNLGIGSTEDVGLPRKIWRNASTVSPAKETVVGIWAGCGTSWIATEQTS